MADAISRAEVGLGWSAMGMFSGEGDNPIAARTRFLSRTNARAIFSTARGIRLYMRVGRDEGFGLLSKWLSEKTLLQCTLNFPLFRAVFRGRVFRLSAEDVGLASDDRFSELALRLAPELEFSYTDSRGTPEAAVYEGSLVIFFREGIEGEEADFVSFAELFE